MFFFSNYSLLDETGPKNTTHPPPIETAATILSPKSNPLSVWISYLWIKLPFYSDKYYPLREDRPIPIGTYSNIGPRAFDSDSPTFAIVNQSLSGAQQLVVGVIENQAFRGAGYFVPVPESTNHTFTSVALINAQLIATTLTEILVYRRPDLYDPLGGAYSIGHRHPVAYNLTFFQLYRCTLNTHKTIMACMARSFPLGDADSDGDGLTNSEEYAKGTNPYSANTDGDGQPDGDDPFPNEGITHFYAEPDCVIIYSISANFTFLLTAVLTVEFSSNRFLFESNSFYPHKPSVLKLPISTSILDFTFTDVSIYSNGSLIAAMYQYYDDQVTKIALLSSAPPPTPPTLAPLASSDSPVGLIVGISVGGVVVLGGIAMFVFKKQSQGADAYTDLLTTQFM